MPGKGASTVSGTMDIIANAGCSVIRSGVPLDTVMAELPVAVANLRGTTAFVERHDIGVMVDETDALSTARAREVLANSARAATGQHFGWCEQQKRFLNVYRGLR